MKVYVAGASSERVERAKVVMAAIREAGLEVTHDWTIGMTGSPDSSLSQEDRAKFAEDDIQGVLDADVIAFLAPLKGNQSTGAWVEFGIAIGLDKPVFASGDLERSIFCERAIQFPSDAALVHALARAAKVFTPGASRCDDGS